MKKHHNQGYTLVEILIASALLSLSLAVFIILVVFVFRNYSFSIEEYQAVSRAQSSVTRMAREIREIRMGQDGSWPIAEASDTSFTFYSDVTNDGLTDKISYYIQDASLIRSVIQPTGDPLQYLDTNAVTTELASGIRNEGPVFIYYNGQWPADTINNPLAESMRMYHVRYVEIMLKVDPVQGGGSEPLEISTGIQLVNLKDNL